MAITSVKFGTSAAGANNATYSPSQNPQIGTDLSKSYDGVVSRKTLGGTTFSVANYTTARKSRKLVYENLSEANKNKLVALFDLAKGQLNSFFYSEDGFSTNGFEVRFVNNELPVSETAYNVYSVEIEIEEQL
tara:strand:- start:3247 stop:3645 length:399 start_codon:yes stop_codon:yes gene_type:complete